MDEDRERELRRMLIHIDERLVAALAEGHSDRSTPPLLELDAAREAVLRLMGFPWHSRGA